MSDNQIDNAFQQLDRDKLKEEVKSEAIEAAKKALVESIQGPDKAKYSWEQRGDTKPSNYDELFSEMDKRVPTVSPEDIDKRVQEQLFKRDEDAKKAEQESLKSQEEMRKQTSQKFDEEWMDLVAQKKMPEPGKELMDRALKGEKLTMEEIEADEGLKARLELAKVVQTSGKSGKVAYYEDYNQTPAGANAPVLGVRASASKSNEGEYTHEDIVKDRRKWFGF